jgi:hypothetical protein
MLARDSVLSVRRQQATLRSYPIRSYIRGGRLGKLSVPSYSNGTRLPGIRVMNGF